MKTILRLTVIVTIIGGAIFLVSRYFFSDVAGAPTKIHFLSFDQTMIPPSIKYKGKIVSGTHWKDSVGEFIVFVTQTGAIPSREECSCSDGCSDAEIYAYCFVKNGNSLVLLWKTFDYVYDCPFDLYAGLAESKIFISDLDSDGIAECTFLYFLSCRSDVSPAELKLIMHEGRKKYAIRGETRPDTTQPLDKDSSQMNVDRSFNSADIRQKQFAIRKFQEYVYKDTFMQF